MKNEFYIMVRNNLWVGCVGKLFTDANGHCYFDDYFNNEYDIDLGDNMEQGKQKIINYLLNDFPREVDPFYDCKISDISFLSEDEYRYYSYY